MFFSCSDGNFYAVKEVSLLDDGHQGRQSIFQLQQVGGVSLLIEFDEMFIPSYILVI